MELEEFIKNTLLSISSGLRSVNEALREKSGRKDDSYIIEGDKNGLIDFDVAVVANDESKATGKAGLNIVVAKLGGDLTTTLGNQQTSRVRFKVGVKWTIR